MILNIFLSAGVEPEELSVSGHGCQSSRPMSGSVEYLQWDRGGGELVFEVWWRQARRGEA